MKIVTMGLFLATVALAAATPADATIISLSLNGDVSQLTVKPFTGFGGGTEGVLTLSGLSASNPVSVRQGNVVNLTVNFTGPVTIPAVTGRTLIDDLFTGPGSDALSASTTASFSFFNGSTLVATYRGSSNGIQLLASGIGYAPGASLTFDSYVDVFTIDKLSSPATLTSAKFTYDAYGTSTATPEASTWLMMIGGLGLVGGSMRWRKRVAAMAAA